MIFPKNSLEPQNSNSKSILNKKEVFFCPTNLSKLFQTIMCVPNLRNTVQILVPIFRTRILQKYLHCLEELTNKKPSNI